MTQKNLSVLSIREVLRFKYGLGRSHRQIAAVLGIANSTVSLCVNRVAEAGFSRPLPEGPGHTVLEAALFPPQPPSRDIQPEPDWAEVHRELQRHRGMTLQLLWLAYRNTHPNCYAYRHYKEWRGRLDVVLRQHYRGGGGGGGGEKAFVDYAGPKFEVVDGSSSKVRDAMVFVGVLAASN